jgi:hypothetical protein
MPAAFQTGPEGMDIYFDPDEELVDRSVFVRLDQGDGTALIGQFKCPPVSMNPQTQLETNDRPLVHWSFDSPDEISTWTVGSGGRVSPERAMPGLGSGGAMRIETSAPSGGFRLLRPVRNLPSNARILIDFELQIASGGLRLDVIDPRTSALLARRDFLAEAAPGGNAVLLASGDTRLVGLFFRSQGEKEILIILSNRTYRQEPTSLLIDNLRVLESASPE